MSVVWSTTLSAYVQGTAPQYSLSDVDDDCKEFIKSIGILDIITRVWQFELRGEGNSVKEFGVSSEVLLVFEPLEV